MKWRIHRRIEWVLYDGIIARAWNVERYPFEGLRAVLMGPRPGLSLKEQMDQLLEQRLLIYRTQRVIERLEAAMADEKPREFRVVVQLQVIEHTGSYSSADSQPVWTQRLLVIPVERVKAFDVQAIVESMVAETVDMTAK